MNVTQIRLRTLGDLRDIAHELEISNYNSIKKKDLISRIERAFVAQGRKLQGSGVLEVLSEGYGFLRSEMANYLSSPNDIYVSPSQIRRFRLNTGDAVVGQVRPPKNGERYLALLKIETINNVLPDNIESRTAFDDLRPRYPEQRLSLELKGPDLSTRVMDLVAPIGMGQRGLIVSPPKAGKTILLQKIANSIAINHPAVHLMVLLIDERPEEVTDMKKNVDGDVLSSTFDESAARHTQVANMVLERAKRLVEQGKDVVILLDSITRLARAFNSTMPHSGKVLSGGVDAKALQKPKRFFGAARNIDQGGSLTIIATALVDTGSRMDEVIFEEFKGTGNMELILDRSISDRRVFPAVDINRSGTRKEELLLSQNELNRVYLLRNFFADMPPGEAIEFLLKQMGKTETNKEFMDSMAAGV
ncbi:MAG: transcription termination factor Rho [Gemmatimonadetes bacterium]|nr:transcription termination factor Rho [Gemmatimonadota bacterium]